MNLKEEAKREKKKLSQMSWSDRIWYIWEYYKFHILAVLLIIGLFYHWNDFVQEDLYHPSYFRYCK